MIRSFPYPTVLGWTYDSGDYARCLDIALDRIEPDRSTDGDRVRGTGVALYVERSGGAWESADVTVEPSGRVVIRSGSSPHGQGHDTTFAQIAADRLGIEMDDIVLRFGDSGVVPRGIGTFGSRSIAMGGSAIVLALDKIVAQGPRRRRPPAGRRRPRTSTGTAATCAPATPRCRSGRSPPRRTSHRGCRRAWSPG